MKELYIDASNLIVGRLATYVAKQALLGSSVKIVNCEKAIITGKKETVFAKYKRKYHLGIPARGPFLHRMPDRFVRRIVRGMLPYKQPKGKEAFERIMCYIGVPEEYQSQSLATLKEANIAKVKNLNYIAVDDLCKLLGAKR